LALLIVLGVFVQAGSIAFGWFDVIHDIEDGGSFSEDSGFKPGHMIHMITGMMVIPLLALLLFIVSFFAKIQGGTKWAGFVLLAVVAQVALAFAAFIVAAVVGFLHGMNALVIVGLAITAARKSTVVDLVDAPQQDAAVGASAV
jgi:heme A synthase